MTRFKKELIKRGYTLESQLPSIPYNEIEAIRVDSEALTYSIDYLSISITERFNNKFEVIEQTFD